MPNKFEDLIEALEKKVNDIQAVDVNKPVNSKKANAATMGGLAAALGLDSGGQTAAENFLANGGNDSNMANKIAKDNKSIMAMITSVVSATDWLVQIFADTPNVIHFQAKSQESDQYYVKWYTEVDPDIYNAVHAAVVAASPEQLRGSFYGTDKQYLICNRTSDTAVDVPGYGSIEVPKLFGK